MPEQQSGSTKQELKGTALDKFMLQKKGKRWDGVPVPNVTTEDLKAKTFEFFRKKAIKAQRIEEDVLTDSNEHLLENLQLKECIRFGIPKPRYFYDMSGFWVEFRKDILNTEYMRSLELLDYILTEDNVECLRFDFFDTLQTYFSRKNPLSCS